MQKEIDCVKQFHETFGIPVLKSPAIVLDRIILRNDILQEEVKELFTSCLEGDVVGMADAITDCLYVLIGTAHEFGIADKLVECFAEVHRSNMSKLDENGNVVKREDGKVLKSNLYSKPDLTKIIYP